MNLARFVSETCLADGSHKGVVRVFFMIFLFSFLLYSLYEVNS